MGALEAGLVVGNPIGTQLIHHVHRLVAHLALLLCPHERHSSPSQQQQPDPTTASDKNTPSLPVLNKLFKPKIEAYDDPACLGFDLIKGSGDEHPARFSLGLGGWDGMIEEERGKAKKGGDFSLILAGLGWVGPRVAAANEIEASQVVGANVGPTTSIVTRWLCEWTGSPYPSGGRVK